MWTSVETFQEDIEWFRRLGDIVDLATIIDHTTENERPLFSITFDDGWIDNYQHAYPILKQQNLTATIFLVTGAIETGEIFWVEDFLYKIATLDTEMSSLAPTILIELMNKYNIECNIGTHDKTRLAEHLAENLKPLNKAKRDRILEQAYNQLGLSHIPLQGHIMNWASISEMQSNGITFGSHTHTHEILQYADNELIREQLETSARLIKERLGRSPEFFCYPNARYRADNADLLAASGYQFAFRMHNIPLRDKDDKYFIPRYLLNEHLCSNRQILICKLLGIPGFR